MDIGRIFNIVQTGLSLVTTLSQQRKDVSVAIKAVTNIVSKRPQDVTENDLDEAEATLDRLQDEFEKPLIREGK